MAENRVRFLRGTAAEYANAVKDEDTFYYTTDGEKFYIGSKEISGGGSITIDSELSDTSENAVQNKVIKAAINNKADKIVATIDADGLMSASDKTKLDNANDVYALKSKYGDTTINVGRKTDSDIGDCSVAEGFSTTASGPFSVAEGLSTTASGYCTHAEGLETIASGYYSHAGGDRSQASGASSFSHGTEILTQLDNEVAFGKYNIQGKLFSIGDGIADDERHNAFEVTTDGGKLHDKNIATEDDIPVEMTGATSDTNGVSGLVPAPTIDDITKFLCGNGTWKEVSGGGSITIDTSITSTSINSNAAGSKAVYDFVTAAIANLATFSTEIVETLPTAGESNILYLVAKTTAESGNVYDEYLYINNAWESIGITAIDLSGYVQSNEMHALTNTEIAAIITAAKA